MTKFVINNLVTYIPEQHRLIPTGMKGNEVVLNIPASRCLQLLLLRPGKVISQQEFFKFAWQNQGQYVTTNTFYQNVSLLRKGLASAGIKGDVIKTVPKEGLLFSGVVQILDVETTEFVATEEFAEIVKVENTSPLSPANEKVTQAASATEENIQNRGMLYKCKTMLSGVQKRSLFINPMLILMLAILLVYLANSYHRKEAFAASHIRIPDVNQCSVYINRSEFNITVEGYIKFLKTKNVVCRPGEFIYITDDQKGSKKVVQRCEEGKDAECEMLYKVD